MASNMSKKFLITGGAGFIGSHLTERLLTDGHRVVILDDLSTGAARNLEHLRDHESIQFVRDTVCNEATVNQLVQQADVVYHLAAAVGVKLVAEEPVRTIRTTIHGTEVVLDAANRFGKKVLITSSSEVYGKGSRVPFSEEDDVVMGATSYSRWCYAYSKAIDEFMGLAYHKESGLPVVLVRLFNTVGPRQIGMYGMVLPRFVQAALEDRTLTVYGDGNQTRCFCHVQDVVGALIKLVMSEGTSGRVFNLGGTQEISMNELAERIIRLTGSRSKIEHIPYEQAYGRPFDDLVRRVPKLDRIKQAIGFTPTYDTDQIIKSVIDYQRQQQSKTAAK
jgi:UDP-glucose 4-epimerase